jgi:uroporphyrinogen-III synthase
LNPWRVLLTRPCEECAVQAQALAEQGVFAASLPLLAIEPLPVTAAQLETLADLGRYNAVIVVSKPAARLALSQVEGNPCVTAWFSVGAGTAAILQERGLHVTYPETGDDSEALLNLAQLRAAVAGPRPRLLIIRGEGGREALAEHLRGQGVTVEYLQLYRRSVPTYPSGALAARIASERLNAVVVSSGQGFQHLHQLAGEQWPKIRALPLFVPSPRVAALAREAGAMNVVDCRGANTSALLAALRMQAAPRS